MTVQVKLFAILRDHAGTSELKLDVPEGSRPSDVAELLISRQPALREIMPRVAFAVNQEYVPRDTVLRDGDELALIPPVSGG